jgi:hypothetical protein
MDQPRRVASALKQPSAVPGAILVAAFLVFAVLYLTEPAIYQAVLSALGIHPYDFPFLDMHGALATAECYRRGIDVIASNPCDVMGRTLDYSPFWLVTASLGIGTTLTTAFGLTLDAIFLTAVFFLPPANSTSAVVVMSAALLSSAVAMGLERANLDLAVFVIAMLAAGCSVRAPAWRCLGYGLIALAALVKYYPGIMLLLALRERRRLLLPLVAVLVALAGLFIWIDGAMLVRALHNLDLRQFPTTFSALNLPENLVNFLIPDAEPLGRMIEFVFTVLALFYACALVRRGGLRLALPSLPLRDHTLLLFGCALILGCFFTAQNAPYRGIYFLFILPALPVLWRASPTVKTRRRLKRLTAAIVFLMWDPLIGLVADQIVTAFALEPLYARVYPILRGIVWWWVASVLLAILFDTFATASVGPGARRDQRRASATSAAPTIASASMP